MNHTINRRQFVANTAATGLFGLVPRSVPGAPARTPPGGKLNIGVVALGWMGSKNVQACANENIVALCDVDHAFAAPSFKAYPKAAVYKDYRVMLENKGDKGTIMCGVYGDSPRLIPEAAMKAHQRPAKTLPRIKGCHEQNWIDAIKNGTKASADFSYSGPLTELALLGNLAKRFPNQKLLWDNELMQVTNLEAANEWVRRPYRKGWSL